MKDIKPLDVTLLEFINTEGLFSYPGTVTSIRKALLFAQVRTLDDLKKLSMYDLLKIKGIGKTTCAEIVKGLEMQGIDCRVVRDAQRQRVRNANALRLKGV